MVIADTGFWFALLHADDHWHGRAAKAYQKFGDSLITTWPVLTEASHLLSRRVSTLASRGLVHSAAIGAFDVWDVPRSLLGRAHALMDQYASLPMDLADASLVLLAEHLGHGRILSTDQRDFQTHRWKSRAPFDNLLPRIKESE